MGRGREEAVGREKLKVGGFRCCCGHSSVTASVCVKLSTLGSKSLGVEVGVLLLWGLITSEKEEPCAVGAREKSSLG
jgi:hypothetical protein